MTWPYRPPLVLTVDQLFRIVSSAAARISPFWTESITVKRSRPRADGLSNDRSRGVGLQFGYGQITAHPEVIILEPVTLCAEKVPYG
jgi:hypothetical protein